jgi:hypothetical protein
MNTGVLKALKSNLGVRERGQENQEKQQNSNPLHAKAEAAAVQLSVGATMHVDFIQRRLSIERE